LLRLLQELPGTPARMPQGHIARARMRFQQNCVAESAALTCSRALRNLVLVALSDRLRSLPEHGDGVTIVSRAEAFASAVQDLAQSVPGAIPIIDPHES